MGWGGGGKVERGAGEGGRLHAARRAAEQDEVGDAPAPAQRSPPGTARRAARRGGARANGEERPGSPEAMGQTAAAGTPATPATAAAKACWAMPMLRAGTGGGGAL